MLRPLIATPSGSAVSTSSFRLVSAGEEAVDPLLHRRQCSPGTDCRIGPPLLAHPQTASSALKSGLVARQIHQPQVQPGRPEVFSHRSGRDAPARCPRSRSAVLRTCSAQLLQEVQPMLRVAVALQAIPGHLPRLQAHCRSSGLAFSPYRRADVESTMRRLSAFSTHLPRSSASARKCASVGEDQVLAPVSPASSVRAAYSATKASLLSASALSRRFLGRLKANPKRCR